MCLKFIYFHIQAPHIQHHICRSNVFQYRTIITPDHLQVQHQGITGLPRSNADGLSVANDIILPPLRE